MSTQAKSRVRRRRRGLRRLLVLLVALPVVAVVGVVTTFAVLWVVVPVSTIDRVDFEQPLAIPPLAESHVDAEGPRVFELTARRGTSKLLPDEQIESWGFNGAYLGPTLRATRGEEVAVKVTNDLDETTSVHWHGMHLHAEADGGPHQPIEPGDTWQPSWRIDQPAATLWYHPHMARPRTMSREALPECSSSTSPTARSPSRCRRSTASTTCRSSCRTRGSAGERSTTGSLGEELLVSGTYGPYLDVATERVRLRLLNASTKRVFDSTVRPDLRDLLTAPVLTIEVLSPSTRRVDLTL